REFPRDDPDAGRIAQSDEQDFADRAQVICSEVETDERGDADKSDREAHDSSTIQAVLTAGRPAQDRAERRGRRDEQSRQRACDAPAVYRRRYIQARATASGARGSGSRGRPSAGAAPPSKGKATALRHRGGSPVRSWKAPD